MALRVVAKRGVPPGRRDASFRYRSRTCVRRRGSSAPRRSSAGSRASRSGARIARPPRSRDGGRGNRRSTLRGRSSSAIVAIDLNAMSISATACSCHARRIDWTPASGHRLRSWWRCSGRRLGGRLMARRQPLELVIGVRVPAPQLGRPAASENKLTRQAERGPCNGATFLELCREVFTGRNVAVLEERVAVSPAARAPSASSASRVRPTWTPARSPSAEACASP